MLGKLGLVFIICAVGLIIRIFNLESVPLGLNWDEAALGYNAYSLLKTGKDEHGITMPYILKSFGDFKPALYSYFSVLPISIFGLNIFSTRITSAIFGTISILSIYILTRSIKLNAKASVIISLLISINPWSIHFSRGAWEANISLSILLLSICLFSKKKFIISSIFASLCLYSYQTAKFYVPIIFLSMAFFVIRRNINSAKRILLSLIIFVIATLPIFMTLGEYGNRIEVTSVFSYTRNQKDVDRLIEQEGLTNNDFWLKTIYYVFHSETLDQIRGIARRFFLHLSPAYLFFNGDWTNLRNQIAYHGYFYLFESVTIVIGIITLIGSSKNKILMLSLLGLVVVSITPAAVTRDLVSGVRSLPLTIPLLIMSGIGVFRLVSSNKILYIGSLLVIAISLVSWLDMYFVHYKYYSTSHWQYEAKIALDILSLAAQTDDKIAITKKIGQPYIFVSFYEIVDPYTIMQSERYSPANGPDVWDVKNVGNRYSFFDINLNDSKMEKYNFSVVTPEEVIAYTENRWNHVSDIKDLSGRVVLKIYEKNEEL